MDGSCTPLSQGVEVPGTLGYDLAKCLRQKWHLVMILKCRAPECVNSQTPSKV